MEHWLLQGARARLTCDALKAELDIERPMRGLQSLQLPGEPVDGSLMGVDVCEGPQASDESWPPIEVYTRGADLVATYREPLGQPFHVQVYWRVLDPRTPEPGLLEAIVSIQTRTWEAYPTITLRSALDASAVDLHEGGARFVSRGRWSYVEAAPPGDFEPSLKKLSSGLDQVCWSYGKRFMERGVIRRLRLRGAFVPSDSAQNAIAQIQAGLEAEAPPLTA